MNLSHLYKIQRRNNILLFQKGAGSGTLTLPNFENNFFLKVSGCGGGSGGTAGSNRPGAPTNVSSGAGGSAASAVRDFIFEVEPGASIPWSVGAGGAGALAVASEGTPNASTGGGNTYLENYVFMPGAVYVPAHSNYLNSWITLNLAANAQGIGRNSNIFYDNTFRFVNKQPESLYYELGKTNYGSTGNSLPAFDRVNTVGATWIDGGKSAAYDSTASGGGPGSSGPFGVGGDGGTSLSNNGGDAIGYGSGGGGGYAFYSGSATFGNGGSGGDGFLLVEYILEDNFRMKHMYHQKV